MTTVMDRISGQAAQTLRLCIIEREATILKQAGKVEADHWKREAKRLLHMCRELNPLLLTILRDELFVVAGEER
jgi:hypothetical protein